MHHYKIINDADLQPVDVLDEDGLPTGETRAPTAHELLQRDLIHVADLDAGVEIAGENGEYTTAPGDALYLCASPDDMDADRFPDGFVVAEGMLHQRHRKIAQRAPRLLGVLLRDGFDASAVGENPSAYRVSISGENENR